MNPPPGHVYRTAPFAGTAGGVNQVGHLPAHAPAPVPRFGSAAAHQHAVPPLHATLPTAPVAAPPTGRSEGDVQWIVGWIRDVLVIAMSVANLAHVAGGH